MQISNSGAFHTYSKGAARGAVDAQARLQKPQDQAKSSDAYRTAEGQAAASQPPAVVPHEAAAQQQGAAFWDESMVRGRLADQDSAFASQRQALAQYTQVAAQPMDTTSEVEVLGIDVYA